MMAGAAPSPLTMYLIYINFKLTDDKVDAVLSCTVL